MTDTPFSITVANGFEPVADAFKQNFTDGLEAGAAFCVMKDSVPIVDLKGGWADRKKTKPVDDKTLFAVFSSGKAVAALVIAWLADEDRLGYEQNITSIWPEFDKHGKGELSVAQILSHQSGLSGITNPDWDPTFWFDWELTCKELASQEPLYTPGSQSGYHPVTYGFLAGEIARRSDEAGRHLGDILRQELCAPNTVDVWIGLPESEHERCADMIKPRAMANLGEINAATKAAFMQPWSSPGKKGQAAWRSAQLAGSNCHGTAEGLARLMQLAVNGRIGPQTYLAEDIVHALRQPRISGQDLVLPYELTIASGVMRNTPNHFYGPGENTVGHSGWGGSCVFADPDTGLSAAYVMSRQDNTLMGDQRPMRLIEALYGCL